MRRDKLLSKLLESEYVDSQGAENFRNQQHNRNSLEAFDFNKPEKSSVPADSVPLDRTAPRQGTDWEIAVLDKLGKVVLVEVPAVERRAKVLGQVEAVVAVEPVVIGTVVVHTVGPPRMRPD
ncbi:hypothetical protein V3C99_008193 [Haemonchus contortus]|uniref:Transposase n=1 Tax=Haemonchus contortus TaxID=6289 RepID=A0A7I5EB72_HAECO